MNLLYKKLKDAAELLELWEINTIEDLKKCYRKKVKEYHPDLQLGNHELSQKSEMVMQMVNNAKDLIDNYIDLYGINELAIFLYKTRGSNNPFNLTLKSTDSAFAIDKSWAMPKIITEDRYDEIIYNTIRQIKQVFRRNIEKSEALYYSVREAEAILDSAGEFEIYDNGTIWDLNRLIESYLESKRVTVAPSALGQGYTVYTIDGKPLFPLKHCYSHIEYLMEQEEIIFDRAEIVKGKRCSFSDKYFPNAGVIKQYFRKSHSGQFNSTSSLNKIISGLGYQVQEFNKYSNGVPYYQYQTKEFKNSEQMLDFLFPHHREVMPSSRRLGMLYCRFDGKGALYTPSETEVEYYEQMQNPGEIFREIIEIIGILSPVAQLLTPKFAEEYVALRGKYHYHVGKNIITLLKFKKRNDVYSGLNIRFYLNSGSVCLYDLGGDIDKEAENEGKLMKLKNIGPQMARYLCSSGIESKEDLNASSTEEIINKLVSAGVEVNYQFAYSIEGAKLDLKTSALSKERKLEIRKYLDSQLCLMAE